MVKELDILKNLIKSQNAKLVAARMIITDMDILIKRYKVIEKGSLFYEDFYKTVNNYFPECKLRKEE